MVVGRALLLYVGRDRGADEGCTEGSASLVAGLVTVLVASLVARLEATPLWRKAPLLLGRGLLGLLLQLRHLLPEGFDLVGLLGLLQLVNWGLTKLVCSCSHWLCSSVECSDEAAALHACCAWVARSVASTLTTVP